MCYQKKIKCQNKANFARELRKKMKDVKNEKDRMVSVFIIPIKLEILICNQTNYNNNLIVIL